MPIKHYFLNNFIILMFLVLNMVAIFNKDRYLQVYKMKFDMTYKPQ